MGDRSGKLDVEVLAIYSNDMMKLLKEGKNVVGLKHFLHQSEALRSQCIRDFNEVQKCIEDYEKKIDTCKHKTIATESEIAADAELDTLQRRLKEEQELEQMLREELRVIIDEIDGLEGQRVSAEEQMEIFKNFEREELQAQMKLSMYASVTNIIPYLDDPSRISGNIVKQDKKAVQKFKFDLSTATTFDICNGLWKMISL